MLRHLLSADSREERLLWCNILNKALDNLRAWDTVNSRSVLNTDEEKNHFQYLLVRTGSVSSSDSFETNSVDSGSTSTEIW